MSETAEQVAPVEVSGAAVEAFLAALGPYRGRGQKVMERNCGGGRPTPDGLFYPMQGFLEALAEFQQQFGTDFMRNVGALIYEKAAFPPGIKSAEQALAICDTAYQMNHRNAEGRIGGYHWTSEKKGGRMVCDNPYPCSFDLGIVSGILRQFGVQGEVHHEDPGTCRSRGATACTYRVEW